MVTTLSLALYTQELQDYQQENGGEHDERIIKVLHVGECHETHYSVYLIYANNNNFKKSWQVKPDMVEHTYNPNQPFAEGSKPAWFAC